MDISINMKNMSKTFLTLVECDNWGNLSYKWNKDRDKEHLDALDPTLPGKATIRWPTGKEEVITFHPTEITQDINDMGHEYKVSSYRPMVDYNLFGLPIKIPLTS